MCSSTLEDYLDSWGFAKQKFSSSFHDKSHAKKNKINKSQAATHMSKNSIPKKNLFPFSFPLQEKKNQNHIMERENSKNQIFKKKKGWKFFWMD